jgi:hypothetical protein
MVCCLDTPVLFLMLMVTLVMDN